MRGGVLVDEPPVAGHVREKYPAGAAVERVAHRPELGAPALERAEIARQDLGHARGRLPVAAEAREVELVQQRRVERDQLLALETVEDMRRRLGEVERLELLRNGVEPPERAAVVVLVVALDQRHRKPAQRPGAALDLLQSIAHTILLSGEPCGSVRVIVVMTSST